MYRNALWLALCVVSFSSSEAMAQAEVSSFGTTCRGDWSASPG